MFGGSEDKGKGKANESQQRGIRRGRESTSSSSQSPPPQNVNDPRAESSSASRHMLLPVTQPYIQPRPRQQLPRIAPLLDIGNAPQSPTQQQQYQQQQALQDPAGLQLPPLQLQQAQQGVSRGQSYGERPHPAGHASEPLQYPKPNDFSGLRDPHAIDSPYMYRDRSAAPSASSSTMDTGPPPRQPLAQQPPPPMPQAPPAPQPPSQDSPPQQRSQAPPITLSWGAPKTDASKPKPPRRQPRKPQNTAPPQPTPLLANPAGQFIEAPQQQLLAPRPAPQQPTAGPERQMPPARKPPFKKSKGKDDGKDNDEDLSKSPPGKQ